MDFLAQYNLTLLLPLAAFAFLAGLIDAIVGGGGLIQVPALLISLPESPLTTIFGTTKIASLSGTSIAAYQYSKRVHYDFRLLIMTGLSAGLASYVGAQTVSFIPVHALKPLIFIILIVIAIYTFLKKDLGAMATKTLPFQKKLRYGVGIGLVVGFYDGFFGPGTGSFLVLGFVVILGLEFIEASAYAKVVNCMTNLFALFVFIRDGQFILGIALVMAVFNMGGTLVGTRLAIKKGNGFIRYIFLGIVTLMILRYGYEIFLK